MPPEAFGMQHNARCRLFESDEGSRFAAMARAVHEELNGENRLPLAGTATEQGRAARWQATACDFIEAGNAR